MRIIGGLHSGTPISAPRGTGIRPTSERVREALFNRIASLLPRARILDLFSGTGALSLEAVSRGAAHVLSVEIARQHCNVIKSNIRACRCPPSRIRLRCACVFRTLRQLARGSETFDLILADPPFGPGTGSGPSESHSQKLLDCPDLHHLATPSTLVIIGHATRDRLRVPPQWSLESSREYGDATLKYLQRNTRDGIP